MEKDWVERIVEEAEARGMKLDALERRAFGKVSGRIRGWKTRGRARADVAAIQRVAEVLGVFPDWILTGRPPRRLGDSPEPEEGVTSDELFMRRALGMRVANARKQRRINTVEEAVIGLAVSAKRWRQIEEGVAAPTLVELRAVSERLGQSLDWLVSGLYVPHLDRTLEEPPRPERVHERDAPYVGPYGPPGRRPT